MKRSILSINGNRPFNYILKSVLGNDYYVTIVSDPIVGIKFMRSNNDISLIIIDTDLFEEDGYEFIENVNSSLLYQMPIVVLSSKEIDVMKETFSNLTINGFFKKPFSPLELSNRIKNILNAPQFQAI